MQHFSLGLRIFLRFRLIRRVNEAPQTKPKKPKLVAYGIAWNAKDPLEIELHLIKSGGYIDFDGKRIGEGLFAHHKAAQKLLWPEEDHHRWSDLQLRTMCDERITVVQSPRDCGKTHGLSKWALVDYWCDPDCTLTIMTSTGLRELELRVWGDIKSLYQRAKERYPWLPGNINQANKGIFTDILEDKGDLRDLRKGLICVPVLNGEGEWAGIDRFVGAKQKRRRLLGDECQFAPIQYVNVLDALDKGDFKGCFLGNTIGGNGKALDKLAEPVGGWSSLGDITKTTTWRNRYGGVTVQLVGTDSPNFDPETKNKFPYLINADDIEKIAARNGKDSAQYWTFALGIRKVGADAYRILTREVCEKRGAFNTAVWGNGSRTRIYAVDAGFGGDPCEAMYAEFGEGADGLMLLEFSKTHSIPVKLSANESVDDQIAAYIKMDAAGLGVPDENIFFDAGMRATLAVRMARIISPSVNAVNFGGPATDRPVSEETFTVDAKTGERRLVKCSEQYSKFVTELWFGVRECAESGQIRGMPADVAEEFALREWRWVPGPLGQRYELETKPEYKQRNGSSPNKADVAAITLEGARQRGFRIANLKAALAKGSALDNWLEREVQKYQSFLNEHELSQRT